jgi:RNA polymerase sigma-70 factor (ECF subfamily)
VELTRPRAPGSSPTGGLDPGTCDDALLIEASLRDPEWFAPIYDRHGPALYRFAARRLGPEAAEDVVADAVLAAFRVRHRYDATRADVLPWLFGILTREISARRRAERARYRLLSLTPPDLPQEGPADRVVEAVTAAAVAAPLAGALTQLAARDRDVLLLVAWADLSYQEVASALRIPVGTVRSRLNRARRKLKAALPDLLDRLDAEEA